MTRIGRLIELGGGLYPHPRADIVIDLHHPKGCPPQDVTDTPWPVESGSVEEVYASHLMEHIPKGQPLVDVMNEAWRVLQPGGMFTFRLPLVGYTDPLTQQGRLVTGWWPYADPTHVSYWWFPESLFYFTGQTINPGADYGLHRWNPVHFVPPEQINLDLCGNSFWTVLHGWEGMARLVKPQLASQPPTN